MSCCLGTHLRRLARAEGGAISQVSARVSDSRRKILVANSDGLLAGDDQVKTLFSVSCVAAGDTGMQTGYESVGFTIGWELFDRLDVEERARKVARQALTKLASDVKDLAKGGNNNQSQTTQLLTVMMMAKMARG